MKFIHFLACRFSRIIFLILFIASIQLSCSSQSSSEPYRIPHSLYLRHPKIQHVKYGQGNPFHVIFKDFKGEIKRIEETRSGSSMSIATNAKTTFHFDRGNILRKHISCNKSGCIELAFNESEKIKTQQFPWDKGNYWVFDENGLVQFEYRTKGQDTLLLNAYQYPDERTQVISYYGRLNDTITNIITLKFNPEGNLISKTNLSVKKNLKSESTYSYGQNQQLKKCIKISQNKKEEYLLSYDNQNRLSKEEFYNDGEKAHENEVKYLELSGDSFDEEIQIYRNGRIEDKLFFKYDAVGNWIERKVETGKDRQFHYKREINYY